jgi:LPXTG-site transpeptidase (sortase) family protein
MRRRDVTAAEPAVLTARLQMARVALTFLCVISASFVVQLTVISSLQQRAAQQRAYDRFRHDLATGVAPLGATNSKGTPLMLGTPVAYLEIPSIGVRQVVVEGTRSENLFTGPGHRRDTPLPGQVGTSLVVGRRASYGGPFAHVGKLDPNALIRVTTGQGVFDYRVVDVRRSGERMPVAAKAGSGRLVLATADGRSYVPSNVVWVDADLAVPAVTAPGGRITPDALPPPERLMASDTGTLWAMALWLQALIVAVIGAIWAWHRWNRARAWVVFLPPLLLVGLAASGEAAKLLPNLL